MNRFLLPVLCAGLLFTGCEVGEESLEGDATGVDVAADAPGDVSNDLQADATDAVDDPCLELDCDDELECTTDSCDAQSGCVNELRADFCLIDATCAADGEPATDTPCSVCSVGDSQDTWTELDEGSPCEDGDLCTSGELCTAQGCEGGSPVACDDGLLCTSDVCEAETGDCRFDLEAGFCVIDDLCVGAGEYEPGSMCAWCSPDDSTDSFSPYDGTCDDADPCTLDDVCVAGGCVGEALDCGENLECATFECADGACVTDLADDSCLVEGTCYESGEATEENGCVSCQPDFDTEGLTAVKDGEPCEDGDLCTAGEACAAGECAGATPVDCEDGGECTENWCDEATGDCMFTLDENACVIDGTCYADGDANPNDACQLCAPAAAVIVWTDSPAGAPCGNSGTCVDKACEGDVPTGESCEYAAVIDPEALPITLEGDSTDFAANYAGCGTVGDHPDVAYSFTPTVTGIYSIGMPGYVGAGPSLIGMTTDCATLVSDAEDEPLCMLSYNFEGTEGEEISVALEADTNYFLVVSSTSAEEIGPYAISVSAACVPECAAGSCGGDGCGGDCGCADGELCVDELCCAPECDGVACGEDAADGCGGTCGCEDDGVCVDGACCAPVCDLETCGAGTDDSCGGTCGCAEGSLCLEGTCCEPVCDGTTCGPASDGCEGACVCEEGLFCVLGACEEAAEGQTCEEPFVIDASNLPVTIAGDNTGYSNDYVTCSGSGNQSGDAVYSFTPKASGIYLMGMPGYVSYEHASMLSITTDCGELLLEGVGFSPSCVLSHDFINSTGEGVPVELEAETTYYIIIDSYDASEIGPYSLSISDLCAPKCDGVSCGDDDGCGGTCGCAEGGVCFEGACCEPLCDGITCGGLASDSCGGTCGCADDESCHDGLCCQPECDGITCGFESDDLCGGFCGCGEGENCNEGLCCQPECDGVYCGVESDNLCGGTCNCNGGDVCNEGLCCQPECGGTTCGLNIDGCGGNCECSDGLSCIDGGCYESDQGDTCEDGFEVGDLPFAYSGSTSTSTDLFDVAANDCPNVPSAAGEDAEDQVFILDPPASGFYTIEVTSLWDAAIYITTDCANLADSCIGGSDNSGGSNQGAVESTTVDLEEGQIVFIVVDGFNDVHQGLYELTISEPCIATCEAGVCGPNSNGCGGDCGCLEDEQCILGQCSDDALGDTCEAPIVIDPAALPILVSGDNTPYEDDYNACGGFSGDDEPDVVYSFTPELSGVYSFGMPGYSNGEGASLLGITTDCAQLLPGGGGQCHASEDFFGTAGTEFDVTLEADTNYFIFIDSYATGEIGAYNFSISEVCEPVCEAGSCGTDGCGGFCGCEEGQVCLEGACCEPVCDGSSCGADSDDSCGGTCGCGDGTTCFEGACCEPVCDGSTCGSDSNDSCGSTCGCADGNLCVDGACEAAAEGDQCGTAFEVVFDDNGVFAFEGDTSDANSDYGYQGGDCPGEASSWGSASKDEAFHLTATVEGDYVVALNASYDSNLFAVTDCSDVAGTCLAANEEMTLETITLSLGAGESAFVIVDGWSNSSDKSGAYSLTITAP